MFKLKFKAAKSIFFHSQAIVTFYHMSTEKMLVNIVQHNPMYACVYIYRLIERQIYADFD